ncbi:putative glucosylceramidase 3 [Penaeus indicus]|uniref:putative glucosylceramidase 3 n=1 Tax=Penaeus indicus TaxID=29960 RepID=UPI00300C80E8
MLTLKRLTLLAAFLSVGSGSDLRLEAAGLPCQARDFGADSVVCVCTADYCDFLGNVTRGPDGTFTSITSSRDGLRFHVDTGVLSQAPMEGGVIIHVNNKYEYQTMMGFGGAFTDATGINIGTLPNNTQEVLLKSYFSPEGIEYNLCRVPIAGSDFSTRPYSYDDVEGDVELTHFSLADEDYLYKLPYIQRAISLSERDLLILGSPWSPPAWMKENGHFNGSGGILKEMWQPYSDYFVKFVQSYEAEGVPIWGLTTQNEPLTGFEDWFWNTCAWTPEDQRDWIKTNLGPTLEAAGLRRIKLMVDDHNRDTLPWYPATILEDPETNKYVDGIALHWYADDWTGPSVMDETQALFPDKFLLYTESCDGWDAEPGERVLLGDWFRGESYAYNIIDDMNHWSTGWVDWNMALDMTGGPNWANNFVDSPIIINKETGEFYKEPMFYAMGHFSKFISPGSRRTYTNIFGSEQVKATAVHNSQDDTTTVVIINLGDAAEALSVDIGDSTNYINFDLPAKAIVTLLYKTPTVA